MKEAFPKLLPEEENVIEELKGVEEDKKEPVVYESVSDVYEKNKSKKKTKTKKKSSKKKSK